MKQSMAKDPALESPVSKDFTTNKQTPTNMQEEMCAHSKSLDLGPPDDQATE